MLPKQSYVKHQANNNEFVILLTGETQARPYDLMCKLQNTRARFVDFSGTRGKPSMRGFAFMDLSPYMPRGLTTGVINLSYKRLVDKLGDASSLGAMLTAERRETWGMVVSVIMRALSAARNIRKLNFAAAARDLGLPYHERIVVKRHRVKQPNGRYRVFKVARKEFRWHQKRWYAKELGAGWLMYSYGVKPLMQDIYNGMDLLQRDFPDSRIHGFAKDLGYVNDRWNRPGIYSRWDTSFSCRQSVDVRVVNPNLWLCNRLGLVNPAQWALEAIPLSFVADWFSNLSDVVNSMTDFIGLETRNPCVNWQQVFSWTTRNFWSAGDWTSYSMERVNQVRTLGLALPKLRFAYERFQWQRGANAISLLLGFLKAR